MRLVARTGPDAKNGVLETARIISVSAVPAARSVVRNRSNPRKLIPHHRGDRGNAWGGVLYDVEIRVRFR